MELYPEELYPEKHYWRPSLTPLFRLHTLSLSPPVSWSSTAAQTFLLNSKLKELPLNCLPHHKTVTIHKPLNLNKLQTNHRCVTVLHLLLSSSFQDSGSNYNGFSVLITPQGLCLPFLFHSHLSLELLPGRFPGSWLHLSLCRHSKAPEVCMCWCTCLERPFSRLPCGPTRLSMVSPWPVNPGSPQDNPSWLQTPLSNWTCSSESDLHLPLSRWAFLPETPFC